MFDVWPLHTTTNTERANNLNQYSYSLYPCCLVFHPCLLPNRTLRQASCSGRSSGRMILELQGHQVSPADIPHLSPLHADSNPVVSEWYPAGGHWLSQVRLRLGHCEVQCGQKDETE